MTKCRVIYKTKGGNESKLFADLRNASDNVNNAEQLYAMTTTPMFKTWLADKDGYSFDSNGEVEMGAVLDFVQSFVESSGFIGQSKIYQGSEERQVTAAKFNRLQEVFRDRGIAVTLAEDENLDANAEVQAVGEGRKQAIITINPSRVFGDTIFHEFGHIYVDLLGYKHPLVQAGIRQLKNTELWNEVQAAYPHLSGAQLEKEVLVTAIGREGDVIFRTQREQTRFQRVLQAIFTNIAKILGIETNVARQLAAEMYNNNMQRNLSGAVSDVAQQSTIPDSEFQEQKNLREYLRNKTANLYKMSRKFKSLNPEFSENIKDVAERVDKSTTAEALATINVHIRTQLGITKKVLNEDGTTRQAVTGIKGQLINVEQELDILAQMDKEQREDPANDYERRLRKLQRILYHSHVMLESFADVSSLDASKVTDSDSKKALKDLQENIGDIATLRAKAIQLSKRSFVHQLKDYTSNPDILEEAERIFTENYDESGTQRWMDALADTNNSFIALVRKNVSVVLDEGRLRARQLKVEWREKIKELKAAGYSINDFFEVEDGVRTGRFVTEIDMGRYYTERDKAFKAASELKAKADELQPESATRDKLYKEARKIIRDFYAANTEPVDNWEQIVESRRKGMSPEAYQRWSESNLYRTRSGAQVPTGELTRPKKAKYTNKKFADIVGNPAKKEFYDYLKGLLSELVSHSNNEFIKKGFIPAIPKDQRTYLQALKDTIGFKSLREQNDEARIEDDGTKQAIVDEKGNIINFVPFFYMHKLDQLALIPINDSMTDSEKAEARRKNVETRKQNKARHAAALDFNLEETMLRFIDTSMNHKAKTEIEEKVLLAREVLINTRIKEKKGALGSVKRIIDKTYNEDLGEQVEVTKEGAGSNILKNYEDWLRMVFYEDFENTEGNWGKGARFVQNWSSLRGIGFNMFSAVNNKVYGEVSTMIEAAAGQFFSGKEYAAAKKDYYSNIYTYIAEAVTGSVKGVDDASVFPTSNIEGALMVHFDILQSQDELAERAGGVQKSKLHKFKFFTDAAYAMQHIGEHSMQNVTLLAMLRRYRVDPSNGKIYRNAEAYARKNGLEYNTTEQKASINEKFNSLDSMKEAYELVNGYAKLKEGITITKKEFSEFRQEVIGVNQYIHGIYNKEDAGAMQQYALGRLAIQFRKRARPGWTKRWGTRFGISFWNERRNMLDEGMYVTTAKFSWQLLKDYRNFFTQSKLHWEALDETQKANVKRSMFELLILTGVIIAVNALKAWEDDEPELGDEKFFNLLMYQTDRLMTELATYSPMYGWFNEASKMMQSPTASWNMMEDVYKLTYNAMLYPFRDEDARQFKSGVNYGEDKVQTYLRKSIPLYNQIGRWDKLEKNNKFYKLF